MLTKMKNKKGDLPITVFVLMTVAMVGVAGYIFITASKTNFSAFRNPVKVIDIYALSETLNFLVYDSLKTAVEEGQGDNIAIKSSFESSLRENIGEFKENLDDETALFMDISTLVFESGVERFRVRIPGNEFSYSKQGVIIKYKFDIEQEVYVPRIETAESQQIEG